jgi:glucose/arabinose dehydrogenase
MRLMTKHPNDHRRPRGPTLLAIVVALLAGCGTTRSPATAPAPTAQADAQRQAEFDRSMDKWHGARVQELISKLGAPTTITRQPKGSSLYVYARTAQVRGPAGLVPFSCVVRYSVDDKTGVILGHRIEGC